MARTPAAAHRRQCPWLVFLIEAGTAYCVPEAGINYKRQMKAAD
jgi:hypothetical protein